MFSAKGRFDALANRLGFVPSNLSDRLMQGIGRILPNHLPKKLKEYRDRYVHHLLLKMSGDGIGEARRFLESIFPSSKGDFFECTDSEAEKAFLHRFVAAGAGVRYRALHRGEVEDIVALDVALRRNDREWFENLPDEMAGPILNRLYYGHFFCHVFHQDYLVRKGHNTVELEHKMWRLLEARGAQFPAEHSFGHLYFAKPALVDHYRDLDPCNRCNPGIGRTSKRERWLDSPPRERNAGASGGNERTSKPPAAVQRT